MNVLLFAPVPYSHVYLGDHTLVQVLIKSVNGAECGLVYFLIMRVVVATRLGHMLQWLACG